MSIDLDEILGRATGVDLADTDVVSGRGGFTNKHPGNASYLQLISEHEEAYMNCQRKFQKLLSLCIIHQLRCKGVRFLKKDSKSGSWQTVPLSQCRLKISQRLRERAPFIKLEQMKATRGLVSKTVRPRPVVKTLPVPKNDIAPPLSITATAEVSSDEEEVSLLDIDDHSFQDDIDDDDDIIPLSAFEGLLDGNDSDEKNVQVEDDLCHMKAYQDMQYEPIPTGTTNKRGADSMAAAAAAAEEEDPKSKRIRTVSLDNKDYSTMLMRETSIISVMSCGFQHPFVEDIDYDEEVDDSFFEMEKSVGVNRRPTIVKADSFSSDEEMFEYLQVLLC